MSEQALHMIRGVASRQKGMKERERDTLAQDFVLSRITYSCGVLRTREADKFYVIIRKGTRQASAFQ